MKNLGGCKEKYTTFLKMLIDFNLRKKKIILHLSIAVSFVIILTTRKTKVGLVDRLFDVARYIL